MKYTLLTNFVPSNSYEGEPGTDTHGNYILFPAEVREQITASDFLKTASGDLIQITEEDSQIVNGTRYLKLYYS